MKFLKRLKETEESITMKNARMTNPQLQQRSYEDFGFRMFEPLFVGENVALSIQASYAHYCSPRKTLEDVTEYETMELAVFYKNEFSSVDDVLSTRELREKFREYNDGSVYPFVPVELIERLYVELGGE